MRFHAKGVKKLVEKRLKCTVCGNVDTIQRTNHRNRETGHIKHIYCFKCRDTTAHEELSEFAESYKGEWGKEE